MNVLCSSVDADATTNKRKTRKEAMLEYFLWGWGYLLSREVAELMAEDWERLVSDLEG